MSVLRGDCVEVMAGLADNSIDAIVTDPPYGLGFMGKDWDDSRRMQSFPPSAIAAAEEGRDPYRKTGKGPSAVAFDRSAFEAWTERWAREAYRILKPGGHLLAFGGSRTYHRLAAGIEDAGFEIRDQLMWVYASGFPKSLDVSKAIDKAAGAEREVVGRGDIVCSFLDDGLPCPGHHGGSTSSPVIHTMPTAPATDAAREWSGWGTALKPAHEPIVMARKPLMGTVAQNVQEHGTGALNIDGCRIGTTVETWPVSRAKPLNSRSMHYNDVNVVRETVGTGDAPPGRWPANVILTDPVFDGGWDGVVGGGETHSGSGVRVTTRPRNNGWVNSSPGGGVEAVDNYGDTGTYSRFFLVPKAPSRERTLSDGRRSPHPTQKPEALIRHLVTMVTPPGGIVLDPFLGSGTLGVVCEALGVRWLGIERADEYADWAEERIADRKAKWEVTA